MKIKLTEDYFIEVDPRNYTLKEYTGTTGKNGKPNTQDHGYYSTLDRALIAAARHVVLDKDSDMSLHEYIEAIRDERHLFEEMSRGVDE